jgi:TrmH family RNA methyltransferase
MVSRRSSPAGRPALGRLRLGKRPLVVVADAVERPGNLGAIVRTACAAGASALVVSDGVADLFHRETVRGSVGTLFQLPLGETRRDAAVPWLQEQGLRLLVTSPHGGRPYWEPDYRGSCAVVVGSERHGGDSRWLAAADDVLRIPMPGPADSLNVAVATGIVLFEAARQRTPERAPAPGRPRARRRPRARC